MSIDAKTLYQQTVIDHAKNPKNEGRLDPHTHHARGVNPLCGDRVTVDVNMDGDRLSAIAFKAQGCAIAKASASMMTEIVMGRTRDEIRALTDRLKAAVNADGQPVDDSDVLAPLTAIRHFPTRTRCATLPWETLEDALDG